MLICLTLINKYGSEVFIFMGNTEAKLTLMINIKTLYHLFHEEKKKVLYRLPIQLLHISLLGKHEDLQSKQRNFSLNTSYGQIY